MTVVQRNIPMAQTGQGQKQSVATVPEEALELPEKKKKTLNQLS